MRKVIEDNGVKAIEVMDGAELKRKTIVGSFVITEEGMMGWGWNTSLLEQLKAHPEDLAEVRRILKFAEEDFEQALATCEETNAFCDEAVKQERQERKVQDWSKH